MERRTGERRIHPRGGRDPRSRDRWLVLVCAALFTGTFTRYVPVTLTSDRAGSGDGVRRQGEDARRPGRPGRPVSIGGTATGQPEAGDLPRPGRVTSRPTSRREIKATTAFGAKYVDLIYPEDPSPNGCRPARCCSSRNVSTEVNTVFENLVDAARPGRPGEAQRGADRARRGFPRAGRAHRAGHHRRQRGAAGAQPADDTVAQDWRSLKGFSDTYGAAAQDILPCWTRPARPAPRSPSHASDLDALLLSTIGFAHAGIDLLAPNQDNLVHAVNILEPTTDLLMKYNPEYTCLLVGAEVVPRQRRLRRASAATGTRRDPRRRDPAAATTRTGIPDNLPIVAAKGGPGGKPAAGRCPMRRKNFPVRALVTNTGWGTGLDIRPNPGIGIPCWVNYFRSPARCPSRRASAMLGPPAIGPVPYPGAPPYGAPLYGPDGAPLYPPPPGSARHHRQFARHPRSARSERQLAGRECGAGRLRRWSACWASFALLVVFAQLRFQDENTYRAEFTNVSGLKDGDFVRIAGVEVGKVKSITITARRHASTVEFSADDSVVLTEGTRAVIRYDNLIGDRYLALAGGRRRAQATRPGADHPARTSTAAGAGSRCADRRVPAAVPGAGTPIRSMR